MMPLEELKKEEKIKQKQLEDTQQNTAKVTTKQHREN